MVRIGVITAITLSALLLCQGCSRVIDEGIEKGLGPTAKVLPLPPKGPEKDQSFLAAYQNFELAPLKSNFPDTPQEFMMYFPAKFEQQMLSKGLPYGRRGKTLTIDVTILAYQAVSSYNKALGPTEEVVANVALIDKTSGQVIARAICIGRTYQSVGLGPKWKAWGLARAIVNDWISESYPKAGRQEREETAP